MNSDAERSVMLKAGRYLILSENVRMCCQDIHFAAFNEN